MLDINQQSFSMQIQRSLVAPLLLIILLLSTYYIINAISPQLRAIVRCVILIITILWIIKSLCFYPYTLQYTSAANFIIHYKETSITAHVITAFSLTFILTIVKFITPTGPIFVPIFIDSVSLNNYKRLRACILWIK